ncbi:methyltransferase domain-containing protein [Archangium minus]|uniref:Methyltransferase domain-containing protein n=2 Tax=Archangium minus TaxID=83450 RepID=A0ABY9WRM3_9BACT|nr:methyltransferase domain-containing protein [Archangium minus]
MVRLVHGSGEQTMRDMSAVLGREPEANVVGFVPGCPLCGATRLVPSFEMLDRYAHPVSIHQCLQCAVLVPAYARPDSSEEATASQVRHHEHEWHAQSEADMRRLVSDCTSIVDAFSEVLGAPGADRWVCELGAGRGGLLGALKARGYPVLGCEPSPALRELGLRYAGVTPEELRHQPVHGLLELLERERTPVRTFIFWHVLEHLRDPWAVLRRVAGLCAPGDHVIVQCPLVRADYVFPEHYFFLTEGTILGLAESSGFELVRLDYDHERSFVGFVLRRRASPVPPREWNAQSTLAGDVNQSLVLQAEELRRLRLKVDAETRLREDRDAEVQSMRTLLEERMRGLESQSVMIAERDRTITETRRELASRTEALAERDRLLAETRALLEAKSQELTTMASRVAAVESRQWEMEQQLMDRTLEVRNLKAVLSQAPETQGGRSRWRPAGQESLPTLLSLHLTHRLYQRWEGVRGLNVSTVAPSINERLLVFMGKHVPPQLAVKRDAAWLQDKVSRVSGRMKNVARKGGQAGKKVLRLARRLREK